MIYLDEPQQWVSFIDDSHTTWLFDLSFLRSGWQCTFGTTCRGTEPGDNGARGCCAHGAHLVDDAERNLVIERASRLDPTIWQQADAVTVADDLFEEVDGEHVTRTVDDACIFLNDASFPGGHGCALHIGALRADERPLDWKPAVCWQVPFRLEEYEDGSGTRTVTVRAWRRSDWGEGGDHFGWWCTEDLVEAPTVETQTWFNHIDELEALVGGPVVERLREVLSAETPVELSGPRTQS